MFAPATNKPAAHHIFHACEGVLQFFATLGATFAGAQEARRVYERLSHLSDRQLAARGLTREDVTRLTLQAFSADRR
jgi:uncharacterized protein YjiS (DUF1127 family)